MKSPILYSFDFVVVFCSEPRKSLPPLLLKLSERPAERLDYLGVSFGITAPLLKFWKRAGFVPVYLRYVKMNLLID